MKWTNPITERDNSTLCILRMFGGVIALEFIVLSGFYVYQTHHFDFVAFAEASAKLIAAIGTIITLKALTEAKPNG